MTPSLPIPGRRTVPASTPEALYDRLTVTDPAIGALWRHQSHVLTVFAREHEHAHDVAIELPTGSGKTLVGALIAEWRRQSTGGMSVFACPTRQLARQAYGKIRGYGIDAVLLIGDNRYWSPADRTRGLAGDAVIVTTYSSIFNRRPRIEARWLVLDDAHAAEGYVANPWSFSLPRSSEPAGYRAVVQALAGRLPEDLTERLLDDNIEPSRRPRVELLGPDVVVAAGLIEAAHAKLANESDARWASSLLVDHGGACCAFVAWEEVLIRPLIVPTAMHPAFADAVQRVYLSATLGQGGELERAFGRTRVERVATPPDWERQGSGRRLVIAPGAADGVDPDAFISQTVATQPRALALVPSHAAAESAGRLVPDGWKNISMDEAGEDLHGFMEANSTLLIAANRYDGIDLPGSTCSLIVLEGLPTGTHLQERFFAESVNANELLRERVRCRIVQGMGRATRSRADRAVILLSGSQLVDFLANPDNRRALRAEIQAELEYALWLAASGHDLKAAADEFLAGDVAELDAHLREAADAADLTPPPGTEELAAAAQLEVLASRAAWRGAYDEAAAFSAEAAAALSAESVAPTRTVQKSMAASYAVLNATERRDRPRALWALELTRDAVAAARTGWWRPRIDRVDVPDGVDAGARALRIVDRLRLVGATGRVRTERDRALRDLASPDASGFEEGLRHLGTMLGFESVRPRREVPGAPDGAWRDGSVRIGFEAKSEQREGGPISVRLVRQANTHDSWIEHHLGWDGGQAVIAMVSPRSEVDESAAALASPNLGLVHPHAVLDLANRAAEAESFIASRLPGLPGDEALGLVERALAERGLTTPDVLSVLAGRRIAITANQTSGPEPA